MSSNPISTPIVLVHGFGGSTADTWRRTGWLDLIADAGRPTIGIDLLGHGTAAKPHDPAAYADLHRYVLDQLPPEPVDAVGFSLGARTLLQAAAEQPDRFARLVVMGVGANLFEDRDAHARIKTAVDGSGDTTDPFIRYFADLVQQPDVDADALRALVERPGELLEPSALATVSMPVLVLLGDRDFAAPAAPLVDALPDVRYVELRRCDHFATPESMQAIDEALRFLDAQPF